MVTCRDILNLQMDGVELIAVDYVRFDFQEVGRTMEELYELGISCMGISVVEEQELEKILLLLDNQ